MKGLLTTITLALLGFLFQTCNEEIEEIPAGNGKNNQEKSKNWLIPHYKVVSGGTSRDGIPSIDEPEFINVNQANYLNENELVVGFKNGNDARAYPHRILNHHEIVNDHVGSVPVAINYCPLTGTGLAWNRNIDGRFTTFGVSGLLYNNNLILYDRLTESNWSQMRMDAVNGELIGRKAQTYQVVETTWATWQKMYPESKVLSTNTGFPRDYSTSPYGDYPDKHQWILYSFGPEDGRLKNKERVLGVIINDSAKAYPLKNFGSEIEVVKDNFQDTSLVVVGSKELNFATVFHRKLNDSTKLNFEPVQDQLPVVMKDNKGNKWDVFGRAVEGPDQYLKLSSPDSYIGYWFAWGAFYPELSIWQP